MKIIIVLLLLVPLLKALFEDIRKSRSNTSRIDPIKRGGKPRGTVRPVIKSAEKINKIRSPKAPKSVIEPHSLQLELQGKNLNDYNNNYGDLFGVKPPIIYSNDSSVWEKIGKIIIIDEGSKKNKWRDAFKPKESSNKQYLPDSVLKRKSGRYSIRFHDNTESENFVKSMSFRFISALKDISITNTSPIPGQNGYLPVYVNFHHEKDCIVNPGERHYNIPIEEHGETTTLTILAKPEYDKTNWLVGEKSTTPVDVTIVVGRLWWNIGETNKVPTVWVGQSIKINKNIFQVVSNKVLWIRLPKQHSIDNFKVGFDETKAKYFPVKSKDESISIPFSEFIDDNDSSIDDSPIIHLWFYYEGEYLDATLCEFRITLCCDICDYQENIEHNLKNHIQTEHLNKYFRMMTYTELQSYYPQFPSGIYKCHYCSTYIESDDPRSPTTAIIQHEKIEHHAIEDENIKFQVITKVEKIREMLIPDLPHDKKCVLCGLRINDDEQEMVEHLFIKHKNKIMSKRIGRKR